MGERYENLEEAQAAAKAAGKSVCVAGDLINHPPFEQFYTLCEPMDVRCQECDSHIFPEDVLVNLTESEDWKHMYTCDCGSYIILD